MVIRISGSGEGEDSGVDVKPSVLVTSSVGNGLDVEVTTPVDDPHDVARKIRMMERHSSF